MQQKGFAHLSIILLIVSILALVIVSLKPDKRFSYQESSSSSSASSEYFPTKLVLPFQTQDVDSLNGEVNPLGVVRFNKDQGDTGHPGIDIPLFKDAPIYAVADGEIVSIKSASDPWDGMAIYELLSNPLSKENLYPEGEGWSFLYEHITPTVKIGQKVKKGDLIATKTAPQGFTAHFQLSWLFNDYQFTRDVKCWIDSLVSNEHEKLVSWWGDYRKTDHLVDSWETTTDEEKYMFKNLLDVSIYPNGPQLCYPLGTDVR